MLLKKHLVVTVLVAFCLAAALFAVMPINSQGVGDYDPWLDVNDDGSIEMKDVASVARAYGTDGTPINKTDLLLQLQSKIDSLNASLVSLDSYLNAKIAEYETRLAALEAPGSVTNEKLAAGAIPFASAFEENAMGTSSTSFVDMPNMSVSITLNRPSHVLILFSAEVWLEDPDNYMIVRALVDSTVANPDSGEILVFTRATQLNSASHSFTFYLSNVGAGVHTVKIQWRVYSGTNTARTEARTLTAIALPA